MRKQNKSALQAGGIRGALSGSLRFQSSTHPCLILSHNKQQCELDQGIHRVSWRADSWGTICGGREERTE